MKHLLAVLCVFLVVGSSAQAIDNKAARIEAAQSYVAEFDLPKMLGQSINLAADTLPSGQRAKFIETLNEVINISRIETGLVSVITELYTLEEIVAVAEFYKTPVGRSILAKKELEVAAVQQLVLSEIRLALQNLQQRGHWQQQRKQDGKS